MIFCLKDEGFDLDLYKIKGENSEANKTWIRTINTIQTNH